MIAEMGGLAERLIGDAIDALNRHDTALSQSIIADDSKIDLLQREIEEKAILTIARRQPMAIDLRDIVGALRVSNDLERIGDLAKNIAKRVMVLDTELNLQKVMRGVEHMAELVLTQIKDVLDAYSRRDVAKALGGVARRRGGRRRQQLAVPRAPDLHDGRPAQHQRLHPSPVLRQEHRADGRPRHQHRRDHLLHGGGQASAGRASQGGQHCHDARSVPHVTIPHVTVARAMSRAE